VRIIPLLQMLTLMTFWWCFSWCLWGAIQRKIEVWAHLLICYVVGLMKCEQILGQFDSDKGDIRTD